jgi:hypothetical protein
MKIFLNNFIVYNDMDTHMSKLRLCFFKCKEYGISLKFEKCVFTSFFKMILGFKVSKERKKLDPKKI